MKQKEQIMIDLVQKNQAISAVHQAMAEKDLEDLVLMILLVLSLVVGDQVVEVQVI